MGRPLKGQRPQTAAERQRALRERRKERVGVKATASRVTKVVVDKPKRSPTEPPPVGNSLEEAEWFAARTKARIQRPDATASDFTAHDRAMARLSELRGESASELSESSMSRSPVFAQWWQRILARLESVPGALEALTEELRPHPPDRA